MDQTIIAAVVSDVVSDLSSLSGLSGLGKDHPSYQAPSGLKWLKTPDVYDSNLDVIWEGDWSLVSDHSSTSTYVCVSNKESSKSIPQESIQPNVQHSLCMWGCPNGHMKSHYCYKDEGGFDSFSKKYSEDLIRKQRDSIAMTFDPNYYVCNHKTHDVCTGSACCEFFWHEGDCHFSDNDEIVTGC